MRETFSPSFKFLLLDLTERVLVLCFFGILSWNIFFSTVDAKAPVSIILLLSELAPAALILFRRYSREVSTDAGIWAIGLLGSVIPLLVVPSDRAALAPEAISVWLGLFGFMVQILAKATLRRSFGLVAANRGVKVGGPYRIVRHPMYAGYFMAQLGFLLANPSGWNFLVYTVATILQIGRIVAEEKILSRDESYQAFIKMVPYRLCPYVY